MVTKFGPFYAFLDVSQLFNDNTIRYLDDDNFF